MLHATEITSLDGILAHHRTPLLPFNLINLPEGSRNICTVEPQVNEGPSDWQNEFAISTRLRYIEVLFHIFL